MPALTDLPLRLENDQIWNDTFESNLPRAKSVAQSVCLVHVSGNPERASFVELITTEPYVIPTSQEVPFDYCSIETRTCEDKLGLGRCVYFYAGRGHPKFGKIALAFEPVFEEDHSGSATPFDTGGLANGKIKNNLPDASDATLNTFTKDSEIELCHWRDAFALFLAAYFLPISDYWTLKPPCRVDPEEMFLRNTDWRAWTFEIRFREAHKILNTSFWCAAKGQREILVREAKAEPPSPTPLQHFLEDIETLVPEGTRFYCKVLEKEVKKRAGL